MVPRGEKSTNDTELNRVLKLISIALIAYFSKSIDLFRIQLKNHITTESHVTVILDAKLSFLFVKKNKPFIFLPISSRLTP